MSTGRRFSYVIFLSSVWRLDSFMWTSCPAGLWNVGGSIYYALRGIWGRSPPVKAGKSPYDLNSVGAT